MKTIAIVATVEPEESAEERYTKMQEGEFTGAVPGAFGEPPADPFGGYGLYGYYGVKEDFKKHPDPADGPMKDSE